MPVTTGSREPPRKTLEANAAPGAGRWDDWADQIQDASTFLESALPRHVTVIETPNGRIDEVVHRAPLLNLTFRRCVWSTEIWIGSGNASATANSAAVDAGADVARC